MRKISSFILLLFITIVFAQNTKVDSLTLELKSTKDKLEIANINLQLAKQYERIDIKKSGSTTNLMEKVKLAKKKIYVYPSIF